MAAVTGAAFGRLFLLPSSAARLAGAGVAAVVVAALLRRRGLPLFLVGSGVGMIVTLGVLLFPSSTIAGLPTPSTLGAIGRALASAGAEAAQEFTPALPLPSLMTASIIAMWSAASASHALAVRSGSAVLAILPPAGLVAFASSLAADGVRFGYAAGFLLAATAMLLSSGMAEAGRWGPLIPRMPLRFAGLIGRQGAGLAATALSVALLVPGLLPGLRAPALMNIGGPGAERKLGVSPIVDIRPSLLTDPAVELFRVRADRPAYWRLLSVERFDGRFWKSGDPEGLAGQGVEDRTALPTSGPSPSGTRSLVQDFELTGLDADVLPAAYQPVSAVFPGAGTYDPSRAVLTPSRSPDRGYRYRVTSLLRVPTPDELKDVGDMGGPVTRGETARLPATVPPRVHRLALRLTRGEPTPYEKVLAIQRYLRTFTYDLRAPAGHGVSDLVHFLERTQRGYCEQFAGAMAVLVRSLGYGTRVAVGFLPGRRAADGRFAVSTTEAHAWPEVYFPGHGWLAFEPTPTISNPVAVDYVNPATAIISPGATQGEQALTQSARDAQSQREAAERSAQAARQAEARRRQAESGWLRPALLAAVVALAVAGMGARRRVARRWRVRRARTPGDAVVAAYSAFSATAEDVGLGRRRPETPMEYARRIRQQVPMSDGHLEELTALVTSAVYSMRSIQPDHARTAITAGLHLSRDVRRHVGRGRALAGALGLTRRWPGSEPDARPPAEPSRTAHDRSGTR
jgi:transglutaminase-like putative cysteine protease